MLTSCASIRDEPDISVLINRKQQAMTSRRAQAVTTLLAMLPDRWWYTTEICRVTRMYAGSAYPVLYRLEAQGMIESRWDESQSRRRQYRIKDEAWR